MTRYLARQSNRFPFSVHGSTRHGGKMRSCDQNPHTREFQIHGERRSHSGDMRPPLTSALKFFGGKPSPCGLLTRIDKSCKKGREEQEARRERPAGIAALSWGIGRYCMCLVTSHNSWHYAL